MNDKISASRIIKSRYPIWNKTTNAIAAFCKKNKLDPYMYLAIFYLEDYLRPRWFRFLEHVLYRAGLLKNPSLGPFQVRISHFKNMDHAKDITEKSLLYIQKLAKETNLQHQKTQANFQKFGKIYSGSENYGKVLYDLYSLLKKETWVVKNG